MASLESASGLVVSDLPTYNFRVLFVVSFDAVRGVATEMRCPLVLLVTNE